MALRIEDLKNGKAEKLNMLEIKIMKKVSDDKYIVADETAHTLLVSDQSLQEGSAYKLIKPSYDDSELRKNAKFAAIKVGRKIKTRVLTTEDEKILVAGLRDTGKRNSSKFINDFGSVDALGVGGTTEEIKLMIVSISSIISGKFGTYKIVNCKDIKNQKNNVNLYRSLQNAVEVGGVYIFTKLKVRKTSRKRARILTDLAQPMKPEY